ncbi:MAG: enoyl-CoA hydratase/isomerase family protein [Myxococcota bacterium]
MNRPIETSLAKGVLTVTFNRPEVRNAMSRAMATSLGETLVAAEKNDEVRAIVLRGRGGHFCAGGDIKDMAAARTQTFRPEDGEVDPIVALSETFGRMVESFARTPKPVVAVLQGAVMGGGFGISCVADVALAHRDARFRLSETSLGLIPAQIAPFLVERLGYSEAKRLAVTGARLDAREAQRVGLVHGVFDDDEALEAGLARTLDDILRCAPRATAETKRLLFRCRDEPPAGLVGYAAERFAAAARGDEGQEGMMAFVGKRTPAWAPGDGEA